MKITKLLFITCLLTIFCYSFSFSSSFNRAVKTSCNSSSQVSISPDSDILNISYAVEEFLPNGITPSNINNSGIFFPELNTIKWGAFKDGVNKTFSYILPFNIDTIQISGEVSINGQTDNINGDSYVISDQVCFNKIIQNIIPQKGCADIELTVQSLDSNTSYAIEEILPIGISPFNIQSNGVWIKEKSSVRWGAYKNNEDRNLNCSITGLPGIYEIQSEVSANGKTDLIPGKSNIIIPSAFKTLNRKIENNKCMASITISIDHDIENAAFAVHEWIPEDLVPTNINEYGVWFPKLRQIRWGTFQRVNTKSLKYDLTGKSDNYSIDGQISINGQIEIISGMSDLTLSICKLDIMITKTSESEYYLKLIEVLQDDYYEIPDHEEFSISDSSIASISGNYLTALQNGRIIISTLYNDQIIEKTLYLNPSIDYWENEPNDTLDKSTTMYEGSFMGGELLIDDIDYYKIDLSTDTVIEIAYMSKSSIADVKIELFDNIKELLCSGLSENGEDIFLFPGLKKGSYYLKLTSENDIDQQNGFDLVYNVLKALPSNNIININPGETKYSQINHLNHTQVFSFNLVNQEVNILFEPSSTIADYNIQVLNNNDMIIEEINTYPGQSYCFKPINIKGDYIIKIKDHGGVIDAKNEFAISLNASDFYIETEPNNSFFNAVNLQKEKLIKGEIDQEDNIDIFKFNTNQDLPIKLTLKTTDSQANFDIKIYIEDTLVHNLRMSNDELIIQDNWQTGVWYIAIEKTLTGSAYSLIIEDNTRDNIITELEPNNNQIYSNRIYNNTCSKGLLISPEDKDCYLIQSEKRQTLSLEISYPLCDHDLVLLILENTGKDSIKTMTIKNGTKELIPIGMKEGNYYLMLSRTGQSINTEYFYNIDIQTSDNMYEIEPNDNYIEAAELKIMENIKGQISPVNDSDMFYFNVNELSYFSLNCDLESGNGAMNLLLYRSSDNNKILDINFDGNNNLSLPIGLKTGKYFVKLQSESIQNYDLQLTISEPYVEILPNNNLNNANLLSLNMPVKGTLIDTDYYTFKAQGPVFVNFDFQAPDNTEQYIISIFQNWENNLINKMTVSKKGLNTMTFGLGKGIYYIRIEGTFNLSPYIITLNESTEKNFELEYNNTQRYATPISKDIHRIGRLFSSSDEDWYGFNLSQETLFSVDFKPYSNTCDYKVILYNQNNEYILSKESVNGNALNIKAQKQAGNYYLCVININNIFDQFNKYLISINAASGIDADIKGISSLISISINSPDEKLIIGDSMRLSVLGHYSDASEQELTDFYMYISQLDQEIAILEDDNMLKGLSNGYASIVASYNGLTARKTIVVGNPNSENATNHYGNLIIAAGGGIDKYNTLKHATQYLANLVYERFNDRLFTDDDIYYLNPKKEHDIDGDGMPDKIVDHDSYSINLNIFEYAVTNWAVSQNSDGPLYIYLIDHGGIDTFELYPNVYLKADILDDYLDEFQEKTDRQVVVIIEACKSGSFVENLMDDTNDRIVITSTDDTNSYIEHEGKISFTQFFVDSLYESNSLQTAYMMSKNEIAKFGAPYNAMAPQLAENNIDIAKEIYVGGPFVIASIYPEIINQSPGAKIPINASQELFVTLSDLSGIKSVTAVVIAPDYVIPDTTQDFETPEVKHQFIAMTDYDNDGTFIGKITNFDKEGIYYIKFYAANINNLVKVSQATIFVVGDYKFIAGDYNLDGEISIKDIIVVMQELVGISRYLQPYDVDLAVGNNGKIGLDDLIFLMKECSDFSGK